MDDDRTEQERFEEFHKKGLSKLQERYELYKGLTDDPILKTFDEWLES